MSLFVIQYNGAALYCWECVVIYLILITWREEMALHLVLSNMLQILIHLIVLCIHNM